MFLHSGVFESVSNALAAAPAAFMASPASLELLLLLLLRLLAASIHSLGPRKTPLLVLIDVSRCYRTIYPDTLLELLSPVYSVAAKARN